ncbi:MAG: hypothetical protein ACTSO6_11960 [Promethearchaeota archaeon]
MKFEKAEGHIYKAIELLQNMTHKVFLNQVKEALVFFMNREG